MSIAESKVAGKRIENDLAEVRTFARPVKTNEHGREAKLLMVLF
jgi:hypothetical protein